MFLFTLKPVFAEVSKIIYYYKLSDKLIVISFETSLLFYRSSLFPIKIIIISGFLLIFNLFIKLLILFKLFLLSIEYTIKASDELRKKYRLKNDIYKQMKIFLSLF